jgi:hypothetical protein
MYGVLLWHDNADIVKDFQIEVHGSYCQIWLGWSSVKIVFHSPLSIHDGLKFFYLSFAALFSQNKLKF